MLRPASSSGVYGPHAVHHLDRALQVEQRGDLDQTADRDHQEDADIRTIEFFSKI